MGPPKPNRTDEVADMLFGDLDMPAAGDEPTAEGPDPLAQAGLGASPLGRVLDGGPVAEQTLIDLPPEANRRLQETTAGAPAPYRPLPPLPAPVGRAATPASRAPSATSTAVDPPSAPLRPASSVGAKAPVVPSAEAATLVDAPKPAGLAAPPTAPADAPLAAGPPLAPALLPPAGEASAWTSGAAPPAEAPPPSAPDATAPPILSGQRATPTMVIRADKALERGRAVRELERRLGQTNLKVEEKPVPPPRPSSLPLALAIVGVLVVLGAAYTLTRRGPTVETMAIEASPIEVAPSEASPVEAPAVAAEPAAPPPPPAPVAPAPAPAPAPAVVAAAPPPPPVPMVELALELTPPDATIAIDGEQVTSPIARPRSKARHSIEITADGHRPERRAWVAKASARWVVRLRPLPKPRVAKAPPARPAAAPSPPVAPTTAPEAVSAAAPPPEVAAAAPPPAETPPPPAEKAPPPAETAPPAGAAPPPAEKAEPTPDVAYLSVSGKVWGAEVQVDGRVVGMVPIQGLALKSGMHTVWVSMSGYEVFVADVKLGKGEKRTVVAELVPIPPADF